MRKVRKYLIAICTFSFLFLSVCLLQIMYIKPMVLAQIKEYNSSESSKYNILIKDLCMNIPFTTTFNSFYIFNKKSKSLIASFTNIFVIVNPLSFFTKSLSFLYVSVKHCNLCKKEEEKEAELQDTSIIFPNCKIYKLVIKNLKGISCYLPMARINHSRIDVSIQSLNNKIKTHGFIYDIVQNSAYKYNVFTSDNNFINVSCSIKNPAHFIYKYLNKAVLLKIENIYKMSFYYDGKIKELNGHVSLLINASFKTYLHQDVQKGTINLNAKVYKDTITFKNSFIQSDKLCHSINGYATTYGAYDISMISTTLKEFDIQKMNLKMGEYSKISMQISGNANKGTLHAELYSNFIKTTKILNIPSSKIDDVSVAVKGSFKGDNIFLDVKCTGMYLSSLALDITGTIRTNYLNSEIDINHFHCSIGSLKTTGNIYLYKTSKGWTPISDLITSSEDISDLSPILQHDLWGKCYADIHIFGKSLEILKGNLSVKMHGLKIDEISVEKLQLSVEAKLENNSLDYSVAANANYIIAKSIQLKDADIYLKKDEDITEGYVYSSGFYKKPFTFYMSGNSEKTPFMSSFNIDSIDIFFGDLHINNYEKISAYIENSKFHINNSLIFIHPEGTLLVNTNQEESRQDSTNIIGKNIPLTLRSPYIEKDFSGCINFNILFSNTLNNLYAALDSSIKIYENEEDSITEILMSASLNPSVMFTNIKFHHNAEDLGTLHIQIPIKPLVPTVLKKYFKNYCDSEISCIFLGNIPETLAHACGLHLSGYLDIDTYFSFNSVKGLFNSSGHIRLSNGCFSSKSAGFHAEDVHARININNQVITVHSISFSDRYQGSISCKGHVSLPKHKNLSYFLNIYIDNFKIIDLPHISATIQGQSIYEGDISEGTITGNLNVINLSASMDHPTAYLKPKTFKVDSIYTFKMSKINKEIITNINKLPVVNLNISVTTENPAYFYSDLFNNMHSYWSGDFKTTGTIQAPILDGNMSLVSGEMQIGHRTFTLTSGKTTWEKSSFDQNTLNATGELDISGYHIFTNLSINNKKWNIQMYAVPYLSQRDIASIAIFGKGISDVKDKTNMGHLVSALWKVSTSMYTGEIAQILQNNISVDAPDYGNLTNNKDYYNVVVKIGGRYKNKLFTGISYYSLSDEYVPVYFLDFKFSKAINISAIVGRNILGSGISLELEF